MRTVRLLALIAVAAAVTPAGAAARVAVTPHAINVTLLHERTLKRQAPRAQADAQIVRDRAAACLDDFRAAPAAARADLLDMYFDAVSGALWQTDRAGYAAWIARLGPAAAASATWRSARARLRRSFTTADRIYRAGVEDPCTVAGEWRAAGFRPESAPDAIVELRALMHRAATGGPLAAPRALERLLAAQRTRSARQALAAFRRGIDEPDAKVIHAGDRVYAALGA